MIIGIFAILLWFTSIALIRSLTDNIGAIRTGFYTFTIGSLICLVILLMTSSYKNLTIDTIKYLLICGFLFALYMILLFFALEKANSEQQAMELGLINYLWPTLTIIGAVILINTTVKFLIIPGVILSFFGVYIASTQKDKFKFSQFINNYKSNWSAYTFAFIAAIIWATYTNLTNILSNDNSMISVFYYIPITGLIFTILYLFNRTKEIEKIRWDKKLKFELLGFIIITIAAYTCWDISVRTFDVTTLGIMANSIPLFSAIIFYLYRKESLNKRIYWGALILGIGSTICLLSK